MFNIERKFLLDGKGCKLSVVHDKSFDNCSIAISDGTKPKFKFISKELYDLLCKELEFQEHK